MRISKLENPRRDLVLVSRDGDFVGVSGDRYLVGMGRNGNFVGVVVDLDLVIMLWNCDLVAVLAVGVGAGLHKGNIPVYNGVSVRVLAAITGELGPVRDCVVMLCGVIHGGLLRINILRR